MIGRYLQAREPVSTLFGAGLRSQSGAPLQMIVELQATQEYLGQGHALAQLAPQWQYYLNFPLDAPQGANLREVITADVNSRGGFAAVSLFGDDADWAGNEMSMANAYVI